MSMQNDILLSISEIERENQKRIGISMTNIDE